MKNNSYKKKYSCDKFGWKYYCDNAKRRLRKSDKKRSKRIVRKSNKLETKSDENDEE